VAVEVRYSKPIELETNLEVKDDQTLIALRRALSNQDLQLALVRSARCRRSFAIIVSSSAEAEHALHSTSRTVERFVIAFKLGPN
jgi:hypothetical protein